MEDLLAKERSGTGKRGDERVKSDNKVMSEKELPTDEIDQFMEELRNKEEPGTGKKKDAPKKD